ncbi:MAG: creatininase family protein [Boseongicola sp. SB0675_bin_26]|nr:creatininase family protein [Boseongicola sp. SB0675_bin_26]
MHRSWADFTARDFAALERESVVAVLPIGATEQHGPHLPLSVDRAILDGIIAAAVPQIPDDVPALFLPTMPVGKSNEHGAWAGTLTLSAQTFISLLMEIGGSVAAAGVRKLVILNSHGGQVAPMDIVARDLRVRHRMLTLAASWFAQGVPDGLFPEDERRFDIHAGDMETSVMLALHGELVRMEHARDFRPAIADIDQACSHVGLSPAGKLGWMAQDMNAAGACGNAAAATAEKGRAVIDHAARELVSLLGEVHRTPLSILDTVADPDAFA